jgi:hypothetical protein
MTDVAALVIPVDSTDVKDADMALQKLGHSAQGAEKATDDFVRQAKTGAPKVTKFSRAANDAGKNVRGIGSNAGMAGIQIQQFVGQIQGGQNAMVALSQQSADLGFVLGAPLIGVFVSLAAVAAGVLLPALFDAGKEVERLNELAEELGKTAELSASGVMILSDEIRKMATVSEAAARATIAASMLDAKDAADLARQSVKGLANDLSGGFGSTTSFDKLIASFNIVGDSSVSLQRTLGITKDEAEDLETVFKKFGRAGASFNNVGDLADGFNELFVQIEKPSEKLREFQAGITGVALDAAKAEQALKFLSGVGDGFLGETNEEAARSLAGLTGALREEMVRLNKEMAEQIKLGREQEAAISTRDKAYESYATQLKRAADLTAKSTQEERLLFEVQSGRLAGITEAQEAELVRLSKIADKKKQALDLEKDEAKLKAQIDAENEARDKKLADEELAKNKKLAKTLEDELAGALTGGANQGFAQILAGFGDMLLQMTAKAVAADVIGGLFNSVGMSGGSGTSNTAGLLDNVMKFAGAFDSGGNIPAGQFGIAGENGPEIIQGPANVTSTKDTAAAMGGSNIGNINMNFPSVTNPNEARIAAGQAARQLMSITGSAQRFA